MKQAILSAVAFVFLSPLAHAVPRAMKLVAPTKITVSEAKKTISLEFKLNCAKKDRNGDNAAPFEWSVPVFAADDEGDVAYAVGVVISTGEFAPCIPSQELNTFTLVLKPEESVGRGNVLNWEPDGFVPMDLAR